MKQSGPLLHSRFSRWAATYIFPRPHVSRFVEISSCIHFVLVRVPKNICIGSPARRRQALVENGVDGKKSGGGSKDKYESHTQVGDLTIIFADTRVILVKRTKASQEQDRGGLPMW